MGYTVVPNPNNRKPVSAPEIDPMPMAPTYDTTSWDDTDKGKNAAADYDAAKDAVNNYGDFTFEDFKYGNQSQFDEIIKKILNREKFSYDLNGDALYQQYKDKYIKQGKMAMGDAIGQASAMTGGYGNSYAQSVGQQAYQAQLDNLNDIVPELYQMAYDKYQQDGQDMLNQYGMLSDDYNREYGEYSDRYNRAYQEHTDGYNRLMDTLGIARGDYYDGADMFYKDQGNKNTVAGRAFSDAMAIWENNTNNAWKQAEWDENMRRYEEESQATPSEASEEKYVESVGFDKIVEKAATYEGDSEGLTDYVTALEDKGAINDKEAAALIAMYDREEKFQNRNWTLTNDGWKNFLGGIDNDAEVTDQYGNTYRLDELVEHLTKEGMTKKEAKDFVKKLQKELGATKR